MVLTPLPLTASLLLSGWSCCPTASPQGHTASQGTPDPSSPRCHAGPCCCGSAGQVCEDGITKPNGFGVTAPVPNTPLSSKSVICFKAEPASPPAYAGQGSSRNLDGTSVPKAGEFGQHGKGSPKKASVEKGLHPKEHPCPRTPAREQVAKPQQLLPGKH